MYTYKILDIGLCDAFYNMHSELIGKMCQSKERLDEQTFISACLHVEGVTYGEPIKRREYFFASVKVGAVPRTEENV